MDISRLKIIQTIFFYIYDDGKAEKRITFESVISKITPGEKSGVNFSLKTYRNHVK